MVATPTSFSPKCQLSCYQNCMEIIKPHQIVSQIRQFLSLNGSAHDQVLIASPGILSTKNEDLSIIVCRCHPAVERHILRPFSSRRKFSTGRRFPRGAIFYLFKDQLEESGHRKTKENIIPR